MTLYWWSHWFWITLLGNVVFFSTTVHTYPSQDILLEYNQNSKSLKAVTKLYQTGTTLKWDQVSSPTSTQIMDVAASGLSTQEQENTKILSSETDDPLDGLENDDRNKIHREKEEKDEYDEEDDSATNIEDVEHKRSAERKEAQTNDDEKVEKLKNDSHDSAIKISKKPTITMTEDDSLVARDKTEELPKNNDHQNATSDIDNLSTNKTENNSSNVTTAPVEKSPPSEPSVPKINAEPSAAEWLKTAVLQFSPPPSQRNLDDISSNFVTTSYDAQKIPFTLENVNRDDEVRRAESEHRTRKSKVLSAEYKQINRYINYSSDPRSLLTRSASASPNAFDSDNESNISSEALAVPRTYFLDAGAISAICFTVFGVCCTVGTLGLVLYRRRYLNKPQTLSEPDSSVYIDDSTMRVSDNSDEMYSLDNDSFLNSLEAMTIQNYWTDTVKHTKL